MLEMKKTDSCYLCNTSFKLKKGESTPPACPACGADLIDQNSETVRSSIECEHIKGALGIGTGELFITNKRIFWIARKDDESANTLVQAATGKNAGKTSVNVTLDNVGRIEDCKKLFRKGVTLHTKSGGSYNFFGNQQKLRDLLEDTR